MHSTLRFCFKNATSVYPTKMGSLAKKDYHIPLIPPTEPLSLSLSGLCMNKNLAFLFGIKIFSPCWGKGVLFFFQGKKKAHKRGRYRAMIIPALSQESLIQMRLLLQSYLLLLQSEKSKKPYTVSCKTHDLEALYRTYESMQCLTSKHRDARKQVYFFKEWMSDTAA